MSKFDKEYMESIIGIKELGNSNYQFTFESGETSVEKLAKKRFEMISKSWGNLRDIRRNQATIEANKASETRFDSGIESASNSNIGLGAATNNGEEPAKKVKKIGKKSWQPASVREVTGKLPGYHYRTINTEVPGNFNKKLAEGWETCTSERIGMPGGTINDGSPMDSTKQIRGDLLMRMPSDTKEARDEYFQSRLKSAADRSRDEKLSLGETAYGSIRQD